MVEVPFLLFSEEEGYEHIVGPVPLPPLFFPPFFSIVSSK